jgi:hypothetical protein
MSDRGVVVREVQRNVARNFGAAMWVVVSSALGACVVGMAAEWFVIVGQARTAAEGSFAALSIAGQYTARLPLLVGSIAAAEVIAWSATTFAMRARRVGEASFFELTLGAPKSYTRAPALVEGLGEGLLGGPVAAAIAFVVAPAITRVERSTAGFFGSSTSVQKVGHVVRTKTTQTVNLHHMELTMGHLAVIAVVVVCLGAALGLVNAFATMRVPRGQLRADQAG